MAQTYRERLSRFEALLNPCDEENPIIDMEELRRLCFQGVPDVPGMRALCWKLLLNYLPADKRQWDSHLNEQRETYYAFVRDLIVEPGVPQDGVVDLDHLDQSAGGSPCHQWSNYQRDNRILEQIDKDIRRTQADFGFFQRSVPRSTYSPLTAGPGPVQTCPSIASRPMPWSAATSAFAAGSNTKPASTANRLAQPLSISTSVCVANSPVAPSPLRHAFSGDNERFSGSNGSSPLHPSSAISLVKSASSSLSSVSSSRAASPLSRLIDTPLPVRKDTSLPSSAVPSAPGSPKLEARPRMVSRSNSLIIGHNIKKLVSEPLEMTEQEMSKTTQRGSIKPKQTTTIIDKMAEIDAATATQTNAANKTSLPIDIATKPSPFAGKPIAIPVAKTASLESQCSSSCASPTLRNRMRSASMTSNYTTRRTLFERVRHLSSTAIAQESHMLVDGGDTSTDTLDSFYSNDTQGNTRRSPYRSDMHWEVAERILFIYAKLNPGVSYVQGMNEIFAPIYWVMANDVDLVNQANAEADAFFCFTALMTDARDNFLRSLDTDADSGIGATMRRLDDKIRRRDPALWEDLARKSLHPTYYAFRWLTVLCSREWPLPDVIRLWDSVFADPAANSNGADGDRFGFLVDFCCAMVVCARDELLRGSFSDNVQLLQNYPNPDLQYVLRRAYWLYLLSAEDDAEEAGGSQIAEEQLRQVKSCTEVSLSGISGRRSPARLFALRGRSGTIGGAGWESLVRNLPRSRLSSGVTSMNDVRSRSMSLASADEFTRTQSSCESVRSLGHSSKQVHPEGEKKLLPRTSSRPSTPTPLLPSTAKVQASPAASVISDTADCQSVCSTAGSERSDKSKSKRMPSMGQRRFSFNMGPSLRKRASHVLDAVRTKSKDSTKSDEPTASVLASASASTSELVLAPAPSSTSNASTVKPRLKNPLLRVATDAVTLNNECESPTRSVPSSPIQGPLTAPATPSGDRTFRNLWRRVKEATTTAM
ncbi:rab-GTPase-TBC domain-containing protein [Syncephalis fuscata]|nr:rab-GTPase-TBC domain-containing protein [Syncephalis fuscata]